MGWPKTEAPIKECSMSIGLGIVLIVIGVVLAFALNIDLPGIDPR